VARRKLSPRAERRVAERTADKLTRDRERLAYLEPGGDSARPIEVESASQIEPHALALTCLRCGGPNRLEEHAAVAGQRVARLACPQCGARREVWFRIAPALPS
jgi:DNA-directed RNA polymerase subunit RPC12/RpoP